MVCPPTTCEAGPRRPRSNSNYSDSSTKIVVTKLLIDGRVIASYSRGKIVLPKSNMLEETRRSRGVLSYSIKGELFGQDYRQQLPFHLILEKH
jgi:hypothetical protein